MVTASSFKGVFSNNSIKQLIDLIGVRRSCPSTAMNCSRNSESARSCNKSGFRHGQFAFGVEIFRDEFRKKPKHADGFGVFSRAGRGSMAHRVPKKELSARMIGIEI